MAYWLFLIYLTLLGAVFPVVYLVLSQNVLTKYYFTVDLISQEAIFSGNLYTSIAVVLLWFVVWLTKPQPLPDRQIATHHYIYHKYEKLFFLAALTALLIAVLLSLVHGMNPSSLTSQRPITALYAGYLSRMLMVAAPVYIGYQFMLFGRLSQRGWLILFLILTELAASSSRSGLMKILFLFLFASAYGVRVPVLRWRNIFLLVAFSTVGVMVGEYLRSGEAISIFGQALMRFFANNSALYLGMTDHGKIFEILTEGQPWVMLDQLFSFARERTLMPSSFRLLEYWGGEVVADERGHIAGYAYGWLGLTYGLLRWWGLVAIFLGLSVLFKLLGHLRQRPGLLNIVLFFYVGDMLLEFFGNLGLDSFVEKIFKGFLSVLIFVVIIKFLESVAVRRPQSTGAYGRYVTSDGN